MINILKKFKKILSRQQKIRVLIILVLMVIGALLETLGVSLIIPLVSAVMNPDIIESNKYAKYVCEIFDINSAKTFVILLVIGLIIMFIFKNLFLFFEYYVQFRFIYNNRFVTQRKLVNAYLHRPYEFFIYSNSGEIMRVITGDVGYSFNLLTTVLGFFTEAMISGMLIVMLFITDPVMTILIGTILGVLMLVIAKFLKPMLSKAGVSQQKYNASSYKWLLQSITGIKELKVARKEQFFVDQFSKYGGKAISAEKVNSVLGNVPRLLIETVGICGLLSVIGIMLFSGRELSSMVPQLSAFAFAAIRLMPSANRLSASYNSMSYQEPSLDKLIENLETVETWEREEKKSDKSTSIKSGSKKNDLSGSLKNEIELFHVTYAYPGSKDKIFEDATMQIPVGKSVGIIGTSGAGKTTAVDILLGLLKLEAGQVLADGIDIQNDYSGWLSKIGYIPQMIFMLDDTIRANVAFGYSEDKISEEMVWKALEEAKLSDFVKELPLGLKTEIGERGVRLSGGQRQRIGIARALYTDPDFLIFDEATSALDNETEAAIMESINELHGVKTMVIIAHRLGTIEGCDIVYRVNNGKIQQER